MARYSGWKEKCWQLVRKIVKERDGDKCYTCPREGAEWKWDAGHYKPVALVGSNNRLSWDLRFIRRQCSRCNGAGQGMAREYEARLRLELGDDVVDWFEENYRKVNPIKNWQEFHKELTTLLEETN